jgi:hypothetical protein
MKIRNLLLISLTALLALPLWLYSSPSQISKNSDDIKVVSASVRVPIPAVTSAATSLKLNSESLSELTFRESPRTVLETPEMVTVFDKEELKPQTKFFGPQVPIRQFVKTESIETERAAGGAAGARIPKSITGSLRPQEKQNALSEQQPQMVTIEIIGACGENPVHVGRVASAGSNAGSATIDFLKKNSIPYTGDENGIKSILGTPMGEAAVEEIFPGEGRAYGWCFEIDGKQPDVPAGEYILRGQEHIKWFYAFSYFRDYRKVWLSYCEPAYTVKPTTICR